MGAGQLSRAENALNVGITNGSTEGWHIQLVKNKISLKQGKKYRFSFKAKSDVERGFTAYIGKSVDPWTSYSGYNSLMVTDTFAVYTFIFDQNQNDNTARMVFDLGKSVEDFTLTDFLLEEIVLQWPTAAEIIPDFKTSVYPNPSTGRLFINNLDSFEEYLILNTNEGLIKKGNLNSYLNQIDIENLPSGIYLVLLMGYKRSFTSKLMKK